MTISRRTRGSRRGDRSARGCAATGRRATGFPLLAVLLSLLVACDPGERAKGDPDSASVSEQAALGPNHVVDEAARPLLDRRHLPATQGLDSTLLAEALVEAASLTRLHSMIVARHGEVVAERHFRGPGLDRPANIKSASKSVLSALVGLAVEDGYLEGPDQPVLPFFQEHLGPEETEERSGITLGHLLSMSSGLQSTSSRNYGPWVASSNWVRHAVTRPMRSEPGTRMEYSTGSTHLAAAVLERATGRSGHAYARERLAEPLGIQLPRWPQDPQGIYFGGNDMLMSPRGLLRFGEMYRSGGVWEGRRVLPREWVEESWEVRVISPRRSSNGYGLGWWARNSGAHQVRFAWGYGGQFLFVVPALELTVVFTSDPWSPREGPHNARLHALLDDLLVPAAERGARGSGVSVTVGGDPLGAGRVGGSP
jgi:CubicO group peptidase (beta-lactamase class C family)